VPHFFSPALCEISLHSLQLLLTFSFFFRRIFSARTVILSSLHLGKWQLDHVVIQRDNKPDQTCAQSDGIVQSSAPSAC
jgi:hypothetical protein